MSDDKIPTPVTSEEDALSLGPWLKEQRTKRKVSLEEIAAVTKIHIVQLKHLEDGKMNQLPAPAFVRGFLVSYAKHLGLDENEVITRYKRASGVDPFAAKETIVPAGLKGARSLTQPKIRMVTTPTFNTKSAASAHDFAKSQVPTFTAKSILLILGAVATVTLIVILVMVGRRTNTNKENVRTDAAVVGGDTVNPENAKVPAEKVPVMESAAVTPKAALPAVTAALPTSGPSVAPKAAAEVKKHQLQIRALEGSWVNVRVDDDSSQGMLLKASNSYDFSANRRIVVSMSDASAVEIKWDGVWYGAPGYRGDVKAIALPEELSSLSLKASPARVFRPKVTAKPVEATPPVETAPAQPLVRGSNSL